MFCPNCDKKINPTSRNEMRNLAVRGESVEVADHFISCPLCHEEWSADNFDVAIEAYKIYRARHHLLQPEEIKTFRKSLGLTQEEIARLLGWSEATINRYENGALQEKSHDNSFRMLMTREGLLSLLEGDSSCLPTHKLKKLKERMEIDLHDLVEPNIATIPSIMTGYGSFSWSRFKAIVAILCDGDGVWKTNLNKLLWYSDILHYKKTARGITGLQYVRDQFGPVAKDYQFLFAVLVSRDFENEVVEFSDQDFTGEKIKLSHPIDTSVLTEDERATIQAVRKRLIGLRAKEISDLSHKEKAWLETEQKDPITYKYAEDLLLSIEYD